MATTKELEGCKELENELKRFKLENIKLKQQINHLQTQNVEYISENLKLKEEIQKLIINTKSNNIQNKRRRKKLKFETTKISSKPSKPSPRTGDISENDEEILFNGYMLKKGKLNKKYQNRWFVLYSNDTLSYYQHQSSILSNEAALGKISLYLVTNIKQQQHDIDNNIFHLITSKRTFTFKCNSKNELDRWLKIIKLRVCPEIIFKGWLYKKGQKHKSWKSRYFTLCSIIDYRQHFQIRYYEDEQCMKYKGNINCEYIEDIKMVSNKYGKTNVLELITNNRIYIVAAKDINITGIWYKTLKNILFDAKNTEIDKKPQLAHASSMASSITLRSVLSNTMNEQNNMHTLPPIAENNSFINNDPLLIISDNNNNIVDDEWNNCIAAISGDDMKVSPLISSDDESSNDESMNTQNILNKNVRSITMTNTSERQREISYMTDNTMMLMDMNMEINKLGRMMSDELDIELSMQSTELMYNENECDIIIKSPFNALV